MSKIIEITDEEILFDDGSIIQYDHDQECCEHNYADFEQLDDIVRTTDFDTSNMLFEVAEGSGFRFGNKGKMFFVPCYSEQNGYYSSDIQVCYNGKEVLSLACEWIDF